MDVEKLSQKSVNRAVKILKQGGIVIFPTDTVYGFLADAGSKKAVKKIYKIKKRPRSKPLPLFVKDFKMAEDLADINKSQKKILKKYWPGKYTFVLGKKNQKETIALRIPKHKFLNSLLKKINRPLAQTSVNVSDEPALIKVKEIEKQFGKQNILLIDGGNISKNKPSQVVDLTGERLTILR